MEIFDLGIAWNSEPDNEFVSELNTQALKYGLKPYLIHGYNFYGSLKDIAEDKLFFRFFLDRTVQNDQAFNGLAPFLKKKGSIFINHPDNAQKTANKIKIHKEFLDHNIPVPATFFLNCDEVYAGWKLKLKDITPGLFTFKQTGSVNGSEPVFDINSPDDLLRLKAENPSANYIAQEKIYPLSLNDKPAWFRVFYCLGEIIPCWWHPVTHIYKILAKDETEKFKLSEILEITKRIKEACQLCFFSTEIALLDNNKLVVINYANDKPDMRKQSKFADGIPDEIVSKVTEKCSLFAKEKL